MALKCAFEVLLCGGPPARAGAGAVSAATTAMGMQKAAVRCTATRARVRLLDDCTQKNGWRVPLTREPAFGTNPPNVSNRSLALFLRGQTQSAKRAQTQQERALVASRIAQHTATPAQRLPPQALQLPQGATTQPASASNDPRKSITIVTIFIVIVIICSSSSNTQSQPCPTRN